MSNVRVFGQNGIQQPQAGFTFSNSTASSGIHFAGNGQDTFQSAQPSKKSNFLFGGLEFLVLGGLAAGALYFFRNSGAVKSITQAGSKFMGQGGGQVAGKEVGFLSKYILNPIMDVARFIKKYTWDAVMGLFKSGEAVQEVGKQAVKSATRRGGQAVSQVATQVTKKGAQVAKAVQKAGGNAVATATTEGKQAIVAAGQKATRAFTKSLKGFESLTPELKQLFTQIAELRKAGAGERQLANLTRLFHQQTGYKFTKFVEKFKIAL